MKKTRVDPLYNLNILLLLLILFLRVLLPYILNIISNIKNIDIIFTSFEREIQNILLYNNKVKFLEIDLEKEKNEEKPLIIIKEY